MTDIATDVSALMMTAMLQYLNTGSVFVDTQCKLDGYHVYCLIVDKTESIVFYVRSTMRNIRYYSATLKHIAESESFALRAEAEEAFLDGLTAMQYSCPKEPDKPWTPPY